MSGWPRPILSAGAIAVTPIDGLRA